MDGKVTELYGGDIHARLERRMKRWRLVLCILAAAGLGACLVLIALTGTLNAQRMELRCVAVSTAVGWVVLYGWMFVVTPARRELAHAAMLRREERQRLEGTVTVTDEGFKIRKSVAVRRVEVRSGEETHRLLVCESRAKDLAAACPAAVYACHGYVAAYEVTA